MISGSGYSCRGVCKGARTRFSGAIMKERQSLPGRAVWQQTIRAVPLVQTMRVPLPVCDRGTL